MIILDPTAGRILPFDSAAACAFADIAANPHRAGRPISEADARSAAIARSRGAAWRRETSGILPAAGWN